MSFRLARLSERDMETDNDDENVDVQLGSGVSPPRPPLNKTGSGPLLHPTSEAKKARRSVSIKQRHESKSTNDVRSVLHDAKSKHALLVQTKAECVAELALFLPTLSATADALATAELHRYHEVRARDFQKKSFFLTVFFFFRISSTGRTCDLVAH
jgi:hypothetical protein